MNYANILTQRASFQTSNTANMQYRAFALASYTLLEATPVLAGFIPTATL